MFKSSVSVSPHSIARFLKFVLKNKKQTGLSHWYMRWRRLIGGHDREYKGHTKWLSLISSPFAKNIFFGMTLLHAHAHYIFIINNVKVSESFSKALYKLISSCMHYLSTSITPIMLFNRKRQKMAKFTKLSFCQKLIFWHQTSSHKRSMCLYCVSKVSDCFSKSSGTIWFPRICTSTYALSMHLTKCIKNYKGQ